MMNFVTPPTESALVVRIPMGDSVISVNLDFTTSLTVESAYVMAMLIYVIKPPVTVSTAGTLQMETTVKGECGMCMVLVTTF